MKDTNRTHKAKAGVLKIAIVWLTIVALGIFWVSVRATSDPVVLTVMPEVPREGQPVLATFKLNNPSSRVLNTRYQLYAGEVMLVEGSTSIPPRSSKSYQHAYSNTLKMGEQVSFSANSQSEQGTFRAVVSTPPYPPQVWSSFVSFASFSTSVMSSMTTAFYYDSVFTGTEINTGIALFLTLIALLIFLEVSQPALARERLTSSSSGRRSIVAGKVMGTIGMLRHRFSTITWILLIVFVGAIYTKIVMILFA